MVQEVGWFDREENASGALASRLSADTAAIRGALGDQIGLMVQNLITFAGALLTLPGLQLSYASALSRSITNGALEGRP